MAVAERSLAIDDRVGMLLSALRLELIEVTPVDGTEDEFVLRVKREAIPTREVIEHAMEIDVRDPRQKTLMQMATPQAADVLVYGDASPPVQ